MFSGRVLSVECHGFESYPSLYLSRLPLQKSVFEGIAQEALSECVKSLCSASTAIEGKKVHVYMYVYIMCRGFKSHPRQLIFLWKSDCLGRAVFVVYPCLHVL